MQNNIYEEIEKNEENGLWWPKFEQRQQAHYDYHTRHLPDLDYAISIAKGRKCCIQAGGNVGIWPLKLIKHFEKVHAFEPDPALFAAMSRNCVQFDGIVEWNNALSNVEGDLPFYRTGKSGTGYTIHEPNDNPPDYTVKAVTIDSLGLAPDAMFIDVEGFEINVLKGAIHTIETFKPVLQIEMLQRSKDEIHAFLESINYMAVKAFGKDVVYVAR